MLNITIMGGTFNPIHKGHIFMADKYNLTHDSDFTIFIPTKLPPHKQLEVGASDYDRIRMCRLALEDKGNYIVSDIEYKREGLSYTIDTLLTLRKIYYSAKFTLLIGADMLVNFSNWKDPEKILEMSEIAVMPRKGVTMRCLENIIRNLNSNHRNKIEMIGWSTLPISSSLIRENLKNGKKISNLVPDKVEQYIRNNRLYQNQ